MRASEHDRRDWSIVIIILLLGFLCIILAAGWAVRFAPRWRLDASMESMLNPDSHFLTSRPSGFVEPLDPAILTPPVWLNVFLTPGAEFRTRVPLPTSTPTPILPAPATKTEVIPSPTGTLIFFPSPTSTKQPNAGSSATPTVTLTPSNTPVTPIPADLSITKDDGVTTYTAGSTVTYTVVVTNNSSNTVTGAVVTDAPPTQQITTWSWTCTSQLNGANGCDPLANSKADFFSDTVNLPGNASIIYTVVAGISPAATGNLVNTASVAVPSGYTDPVSGNNSATDTDAPAPSADLSITKTDNSTDYVGGAIKTYEIKASNAGPSNVTGATVTDAFTNQNIQAGSVSWTCSGTGDATCAPSASGTGDINDTVNIPAGFSITYLVTVQAVSNPSGPLVNTASVAVPSGYTDPNTGNNSATDTDTLIVVDSLPPQIGTTPGGTPCCYELVAGGILTLQLTPPLVVGGHPGDDLVYYELPQGSNPGIWMDMVILQIGDGSNWYTILDWGDNNPNPNTNIVSPPGCGTEVDNCVIDASLLYNSTGITFDLDLPGYIQDIPNGTYPYFRIIAYPMPPDVDNQIEVDAIYIFPFP